MSSYVSDPATDDFLQKARDRYEFGLKEDAIDRKEAEDDNKFGYAEDSTLGQWDPTAKRARRKRPTLQWNRIPTYTHQVVNDGRQNKPAIKVAALDDGIPETADFFAGRIRQIEYDTDIDTAKDTAREQQVMTGRGWLRVDTEYVPGKKDRQRICVTPIRNQFSVIDDPGAIKYDRSDSNWRFIISYITKEEHIREYGKESVVYRLDFATMGADNPAPGWIGVGEDGKMIQVAEYWVKEYDQSDPEKYEICQYIIDGAQILRPKGGKGPEKVKWIGSTIPQVPFWGEQAVVNGIPRTFSLIRNAKSPQRLVNLFVSNIVEKLGQMAKVPYKIPIGGIPANLERDWKDANNTELAYLLFNAYDSSGRQLPPPDRVDYEPPIQGMVVGLQYAIDAIKAAMGIFDAAIGAKSNETSGRAILTRQKESDIANYHFPDNEARSNKYLGEILIDLIPKIDKEGDTVPVRTPDGKTHLVPIGEPHRDYKTGAMVTHDLLNGQYGVYVETGPSYNTAKKEENEKVATILQAAPELMTVFGDLFFQTSDIPNAEELADRLKRFINMKTPGLIQEQQGNQPPIPPQVQAQMVQLSQKLQTTEKFAQGLHEQIQSKQPELEVKKLQISTDADIRKYVVDQQEETKRTLGLAALASQEGLAKLEQELGVVHKKLDVALEAGTQASKQAHEKELAAQSHQQDLQQGQQQHAGAMEQQQNAQDAAAEQSEAENNSQDSENNVESQQET